MIKVTPQSIKKHYRDTKVVTNYIEKRFVEPIGFLKHQIQIKLITDILNTIKKPIVLDLACGPARISKDIRNIKEGIAIDSSQEMIFEANKILRKPWKVKKGDAFNLKLKNNYFDVVLSFRFVRHFKERERIRIYEEIAKVLKKDKYFICDVLNKKKVKWLRLIGIYKYTVYDELYDLNTFKKEVESNGFELISTTPVIKEVFLQAIISKIAKKLKSNKMGLKLITQIERISGGEPWEWIAICKKS